MWILSKAALAMGDMAETIRAAKRALSLGAEGVELTALVGYAMLRMAGADETVAFLAGAAERYPRDPTIRCMLGRAYQARGSDDMAVACYRRALEANPDNELARSLLAAAQAVVEDPK